MYHVVGYFGSRLSYATVAAALCRGLREQGLLAGVTNLDDRALEEYEDLVRLSGDGTHAILIVDPTAWVFDAFEEKYGRGKVAVFASPNTDSLSEERAQVCSRAAMVLVPSQWCMDTVSRSLDRRDLPHPEWLCKVPLGVSPDYLGVHERRRPGSKLRLLHLATDFSWPGRKGTSELLVAWAEVQSVLAPIAELTLHVPLAAYEPAHYAVADLSLDEVNIAIAPHRGSTDEQLAWLYEHADVVVLPSRCEGFGMMILAACVSGTPLVTTGVTGQADFLPSFEGWLGVPTDRTAELEHEPGFCPVVEPKHVATSLLAACSPMVLSHLRAGAQANSQVARDWCWDVSAREWVATLERWRNQP